MQYYDKYERINSNVRYIIGKIHIPNNENNVEKLSLVLRSETSSTAQDHRHTDTTLLKKGQHAVARCNE